jgi:hypothetical protein
MNPSKDEAIFPAAGSIVQITDPERVARFTLDDLPATDPKVKYYALELDGAEGMVERSVHTHGYVKVRGVGEVFAWGAQVETIFDSVDMPE